MEVTAPSTNDYCRALNTAISSPAVLIRRYGKLFLFALILFDGVRMADVTAAPDRGWGRTSSSTVKITLRIPEKIDHKYIASVRRLKNNEEAPIDVKQLMASACHSNFSAKAMKKINLGKFQLKSRSTNSAGISQSLTALCKKQPTNSRALVGSIADTANDHQLMFAPI